MELPGASQGLSQAEAARRLLTDGPNALPSERPQGVWHLVREALQEPMFALLLAAGSLYLLLGNLQEGLILFGLVLVVLALTLHQEEKTTRALEALRDGQPQRIAGRDVVCGDILILAEGDRIAADATLLTGGDVLVDESLLTGEAAPASKHVIDGAITSTAARPGGDNLPWLFSGTLVVRGHGAARVTATGARSEIGRIGSALDTLNAGESPLKRQTAQLVQVLAMVALGASVFLFVAFGWMRGDCPDNRC